MKMTDQTNLADPDLERIKSIIIERVKTCEISLVNDSWMLLVLALFGRKIFNENDINEMVNKLKKFVVEDGEPS